jgi:diguanylate cyclase (GGDEF)-like protein/PAS domain S-box-containing protein
MNMRHPGDNLLLIEDNRGDAMLIREMLADPRVGPFQVEWVENLSGGLERLSKGGIAAIVTDLSLPDSQDLQTVDRLLLAAPRVPILVVSGLDDEDMGSQAVQHGAQDYLPKGQLNRYTLSRALRNMMNRKTAEDALFIEKERAQVTLNSIGDAVLCTDSSGNITYLNPVAEKMTGWSREEASGRPLAEVFRIIDGATRLPAQNPLEMAIEQNKTVGLTGNCILIRRDGFESSIEDSTAPIHDRDGHGTGAVIVFHDVGAARTMSLQMTHSAQHDFLTDLPNRMLLNDRITQAVSFAERQGRQLAVLFVDLDHFKKINDSLGHAIGDKLLQSVAGRLIASVRRSDTVSRQGGDEFVVLLSQVEHAEDAAFSARKILAAITSPHHIDHRDLYINVSIGISTYPGDGQDAESLMNTADSALYDAKEHGRNNYQFFRPDMHARVVERQSLEGNLRVALGRNEFLLHYQPKISLETGEITGVEALIRWMHPDRGLVPPLQFVPIAEECGLIVPIGQWVLLEACKQARAWRDSGLRPVPVAVNVSAVEFLARDFLSGVRAVLIATGVEPRNVELELTESVLMQDAESTVDTLHALKAMGVRLTVDDFGTGYSSFSYLRRFPLDALKIDRSFVHEVTANSDDATIVSAIISIGKSLKQRVIAEGVETREQLEFLQTQGCGEGQGYYFSRPVVAEQFTELLRSGIRETVVH